MAHTNVKKTIHCLFEIEIYLGIPYFYLQDWQPSLLSVHTVIAYTK